MKQTASWRAQTMHSFQHRAPKTCRVSICRSLLTSPVWL
jgi:hypothetical protein